VRVLLVSQYYSPEIGATQNRMRSFVDALLAAGHSVTVVCEQPNHPEGTFQPGYGRTPLCRERSGRLTVYRTWVATSPHKSPAKRMLFYGSFAAATVAVTVLLHRQDVVLATSPPLPGAFAAVLTARLRRSPVVLDIRDLWPAAAEALGEISDRRLLSFFARIERWMYRNSTAVTATTRPFCKYIDARAHGLRTLHLPNGALDELVSSPERQPPGGPRFRLGYVGNFGIAQGLSIVLDAAERLAGDPVQLMLVGGGPLESELRRQIRERRLSNVELRPAVSTHEVGELLLSCNALLIPLANHPLLADFMPSKLYDAMAVGRPVIVAANGEAPAFVAEHGFGLVVPPEDGTALAAAVRELARDPARAAKLGSAGKARAPSYARSRQADRMCKLLEAVGEPSLADRQAVDTLTSGRHIRR
jgi:colanic acid biosynthesis glycosyl transferase WcaI